MTKFQNEIGSMEFLSKGSSAPASAPRKGTSFFHLPLELRLIIYRHYVPQRRCVEVSTPLRFMDNYSGAFKGDLDLDHRPIDKWSDVPAGNRTGIFRVSKQASEETLDILYGEMYSRLSSRYPSFADSPKPAGSESRSWSFLLAPTKTQAKTTLWQTALFGRPFSKSKCPHPRFSERMFVLQFTSRTRRGNPGLQLKICPLLQPIQHRRSRFCQMVLKEFLLL